MSFKSIVTSQDKRSPAHASGPTSFRKYRARVSLNGSQCVRLKQHFGHFPAFHDVFVIFAYSLWSCCGQGSGMEKGHLCLVNTAFIHDGIDFGGIRCCGGALAGDGQCRCGIGPRRGLRRELPRVGRRHRSGPCSAARPGRPRGAKRPSPIY